MDSVSIVTSGQLEDTARADWRPVPPTTVRTPEVVDIEKGYLIWDARRVRTHWSTEAILDRFLKLAEADDEAIVQFAKRWGALAIDEEIAGRLRFREPLSTWRDLASRARVIRDLGIRVNMNREALGVDIGLDVALFRSPLAEARVALQLLMRRLVAKARLQPRLYWDNTTRQWQIDFDSSGRSNLLAVILMRLMVEIVGGGGLVVCSNPDCKRAYKPKRLPSPGRPNNYCGRRQCQQAKWRNSKRKQRKRDTT